MSKSTTTAIIISVILFVVAISGISLMIYQVNQQSDQLDSQVATLEKEQAQENSYFKLQRLSEDTEVDRVLLKSYFLEQESNSIDFLNLVESIAPEAGVDLKTDKLDVLKRKGEESEWIEATFTFSASRERVLNFIQVLETLPYVLRLTTIEMSLKSASSWQAQVTMQVQILDYVE